MDKILLDRVIGQVSKPSRYIGNEYNMAEKNPEEVAIRFAFAFPDVYEVGMSHLGMKILYHMLNDRDDTYCERVFAPWVDMEAKMREFNIPLFALETKDPVSSFDIIGFTLQYEMSYSNIINMLDLAGIPLFSHERDEDSPLLIAGGPCAYNAEPIADFIDIIVLGEGEDTLNKLLDLYKEYKASGRKKLDFLVEAASMPGIYIPQFYDVEYDAEGRIKSIDPNRDDIPRKIRKTIVKDLDETYFPQTLIVPYTDIVHDRIMLELFRGCTRGCRFCQAGMIYRPVRERSTEKLLELAEKLVESTGYEEISLSSLSTSDYSRLEELVRQLMERFSRDRVALSLPSLRVDSFAREYIQEIQKTKKTGLTFAPEAGTQRLRDVINKGVTEEDILSSALDAFNSGWNSVKLYFMIGLPTEQYEDLDGIGDLARKIAKSYYSVDKEIRQRGLKITVSVSSFVPKPFTPFQWEPQDKMEELRNKQKYLSQQLKIKNVEFNWHDPELSFLEAVFARGDRRLSRVLVNAVRGGARFDGWAEHFKWDVWMKAFEEASCSPEDYANRRREKDEILPWDHIDTGVTKRFLWNEYQKALKGEITPDCRNGCSGCGLMSLEGGVCI